MAILDISQFNLKAGVDPTGITQQLIGGLSTAQGVFRDRKSVV